MLSLRLRHVSLTMFITVVRKAVMRTSGIAAPEFAAPPSRRPVSPLWLVLGMGKNYARAGGVAGRRLPASHAKAYFRPGGGTVQYPARPPP